MIAAALNDAFLVKQLVLEGAPLQLRDRKGRTAATMAAVAFHKESLHALATAKQDRYMITMKDSRQVYRSISIDIF
jgi:hypothetical protein